MIEAVGGDDLLDVGGRAVDRDEPVVVDVAVQIVDEVGVGVDGDQRRVRRQPVEDRPGEGADARPIFDEQLASSPVDRLQHLVDQDLARRDDRSDHHRMLQEAAQELPARALAAAAGAAA